MTPATAVVFLVLGRGAPTIERVAEPPQVTAAVARWHAAGGRVEFEPLRDGTGRLTLVVGGASEVSVELVVDTSLASALADLALWAKP